MLNLSALFNNNKNDATATYNYPWSADSSNNGLLSHVESPRFRQGHRRQLSLSRLRSRKALCSVTVFVILLLVFALSPVSVNQIRDPYHEQSSKDRTNGAGEIFLDNEDGGGIIPLGQSRERKGREFFWWEQFPL